MVIELLCFYWFFMKKIKLSICIPTYERADKAIVQVKFFLNELSNVDECEEIELIVRDNNSSCDSFDKLSCELKAEDVKLYRNDTNLGLVGNLNALLQDSQGEYIWFVGDDDLLYPNIIQRVLKSCDGSGLVFINHRAIDNTGKIIFAEAFNPDVAKTIHHVFRYSGTTMMFMSACVYKQELLTEVFSNSKLNLSLPFLASLYTAEKGGCNYIYDIMIDNVWGDTSWSCDSRSVFRKQVPKDILASISFSRNKLNAIYSLVYYFFSKLKKIISF